LHLPQGTSVTSVCGSGGNEVKDVTSGCKCCEWPVCCIASSTGGQGALGGGDCSLEAFSFGVSAPIGVGLLGITVDGSRGAPSLGESPPVRAGWLGPHRGGGCPLGVPSFVRSTTGGGGTSSLSLTCCGWRFAKVAIRVASFAKCSGRTASVGRTLPVSSTWIRSEMKHTPHVCALPVDAIVAPPTCMYDVTPISWRVFLKLGCAWSVSSPLLIKESETQTRSRLRPPFHIIVTQWAGLSSMCSAPTHIPLKSFGMEATRVASQQNWRWCRNRMGLRRRSLRAIMVSSPAWRRTASSIISPTTYSLTGAGAGLPAR
jgi:hypothetical protein